MISRHICRLSFLALVQLCFVAAVAHAAPVNYFEIDRDGDGYGIGDIDLKGPDADDTDPQINTSASVFKKYSSLSAFLAHRGYSPERIFYLAPQGDDQTAQIDDPDKPYKNYSKIGRQLKPGDMVMFRGGTYHQQIKHKDLAGAEGQPIIFMASPGEKVLFDDCGTFRNSACITLEGAKHIVFDGLQFDNQKNGNMANAIYLNGTNRWSWGPVIDVTIRNILARNLKSGLRAMHNIHDVLIENVVVHETQSHNVYFGTAYNELTNTDIRIRDSLFYKAARKYDGRFCLQHNGPVRGLIFERNICHSNYTGGGFSIVNGSDSGVIRNNLIFNNAKQGIVFYGYNTKNGSGKPFMNNLVLNNTIWVGHYDMLGEEKPLHHAGIHFNDASGRLDMLYTNIRNNIIVTQAGPAIEFNQSKFLPETIIKHNLIFQEIGDKIFKILTVKKPIRVGEETYKLEDVEEAHPLTGNNIFTDPEFRAANVDYVQKPEQFDFSLSDSSSARGFCPVLAEFNIEQDLFGRARPGEKIDAGCFQTTQ